jgi:hypothetical protein
MMNCMYVYVYIIECLCTYVYAAINIRRCAVLPNNGNYVRIIEDETDEYHIESDKQLFMIDTYDRDEHTLYVTKFTLYDGRNATFKVKQYASEETEMQSILETMMQHQPEPEHSQTSQSKKQRQSILAGYSVVVYTVAYMNTFY